MRKIVRPSQRSPNKSKVFSAKGYIGMQSRKKLGYKFDRAFSVIRLHLLLASSFNAKLSVDGLNQIRQP